MKLIAFIILAVVALGAAVFGTLAVTGVVIVPWAHRGPPPQRLAPGSALCPVSVRDVHAYTAVAAEDLIEPQTGRPATKAQSAASLAAADPPFRETRQIVGRVLRDDLPVASLFHESDFYPIGTAPGSAAGVPVGKRAITLDATQVSGVRDLRLGDHVDLDATQAFDPSKAHGNAPTAPVPLMTLKTASVQHLARNGVVVRPLTVRQVPYMTAGGLTSAAQVRTKPVEEVTIAVGPGEASAVEQAVATSAQINCLLHSGLATTSPAADGTATGDSGPPIPHYTPVEQIVGDKHTYKYLPVPPAIGDQGAQP